MFPRSLCRHFVRCPFVLLLLDAAARYASHLVPLDYHSERRKKVMKDVIIIINNNNNNVVVNEGEYNLTLTHSISMVTCERRADGHVVFVRISLSWP